MSWMIPSIITTLLGTLVLVAVYFHLFTQSRERYLGIWTLGWAVYSLRFVSELWMLTGQKSAILIIANQLFSLLGGLLLLWGTYVFLGKSISKWWVYTSALGATWIIAGALSQLSFLTLSLPTFMLLGAISIWTGMAFLRSHEIKGVGSYITGWSFIIWGIHKIDYPFLRPVLWFAPWGFLIGALLQFLVTAGILLVYFQKARKDLRISEERFRLLAENAQDLIYRYRLIPTRRFDYISPSATAITGYAPEEYYADPDLPLKIVHQEDQLLLAETMQSAIYPKEPYIFRLTHKDGAMIWTEHRNVPILDKSGNLVALEGIARDITERKRAENALKESEEQFRATFDQAAVGIVHADMDGRFLRANRKFCDIAGYTEGELTGLTFKDITHPEDIDTDLQYVRRLLASEINTFSMEKRYIRKDRSHVWVNLTVSLVREASGELKYFIGVIEDITERKWAEEMIKHMAYYDPLTDLPNRMLLNDRLNLALANARRHDQMLAVLFLDLDNFKTINDTLGHTVGDRLLQGVAQRLKKCLRKGDTIARLGGDEFTLLLPQINHVAGAVMTAQKILEALKPPFNFDGRRLYVTTSIGVAVYPNDGEDAQVLLKNADVALYRAKERGRNNYQLYSPAMDRAFDRLSLESSMHRALEREEFVINYQPQVDLSSGKIVGMEALLRWQHPELGLMSPAEFIPVAEENGLIVPIGEWVLRAACRQGKAWRDAGYLPIRMAVNLSARQFQQQDLAKMIGQVLKETGLGPEHLELEITESTIIKDIDTAVAVIHELKEMGIRVSIDDFGTGYSSLSNLKRFPIDHLKIDRSFILDIMASPSDSAIATAIITLAHSLHMKAIAEGVETKEQVEYLRSLNCDIVQGYVFGHPLSAEGATDLLAEERLLCA